MRIVLAVDGSAGSHEAAKALVHFAPLEEVLLLNVMKIPTLHYPSAGTRTKVLSASVEKELRKEADEILERVGAVLPPDAKSIAKHVAVGDPAEMILTIATDSNANLIVMGARGLTRLSELVLGSVSHRVMNHASCSTLIVKSPMTPLTYALLPIESAEDANRMTDFLAKMPFREPPHLTLLHAVPFAQPHWLEGAMIPESYRNELMVAGEAMIGQAVCGLTSLGYQSARVLLDGPPEELILKSVRDKQPDLIMMGSHGRRGFSRFLLGSVSHTVVHRSPCSVLIVR